MVYRFVRSQKLKMTLPQAWDFLSDPNNLCKITPPSMHFLVKSGADRAMHAGQVIVYKVYPFPAIPTTWVTEITHVKDNEFFVDEQRFGPYVFWHHQHFIKAIDGGVLMEDIVHYKIPMGFLGQMLNGIMVAPKLNKIFAFRQKVLANMFGEIQ